MKIVKPSNRKNPPSPLAAANLKNVVMTLATLVGLFLGFSVNFEVSQFKVDMNSVQQRSTA